MKFITFSGVDGSGKSTQLGILKEKLEGRGFRVVYFHAVSFSLLETLRSKLFGTRQAGSAKAKTTSSVLSLWLRRCLLIIDVVRFKRYFARLQKESTDYLISDRYFYDTLINIAYLANKSPSDTYSQFVYHLLPKPDLALYLRITPSRVMQRERAPEQGLAYLEAKTALFESILSDWEILPIDADQSIDTLSANISDTLKKRLV